MALCNNLTIVARALADLAPSEQAIICASVEEMTRGMHLYSRRFATGAYPNVLRTESDLERYCYFVAGVVGHMLTSLFVLNTPSLSNEAHSDLKSRAEAFGYGLQLTNILKDVADDHARGVIFVPESLWMRAGVRAEDILEPRWRSEMDTALAPLFDQARVALCDALRYVLALPRDAASYRAFCLMPLWMAFATLEHAQPHPNLLDPNHKIKIARAEVEAIVCAVLCHAQDDDAITAYAQRYVQI